MRIILLLFCSLSLLTQLTGQSAGTTFKLQLEPGQTYEIEVDLQRDYYPDPKQPPSQKNSYRFPTLYKQALKYQLEVLDRSDDRYSVELVRLHIYAYNSTDGKSIRVGNYNIGKRMNRTPQGDTVRFEMDFYGQVIGQENPDSIRTGYAVPDGYQLETRVVMPELTEKFTHFLSYLHPKTVEPGTSWVAPDGTRLTLVKKQAGLWHIRANDQRDLYIDPETNWIRYMEQHELLKKDVKRPDYFFDIHTLVQGRMDASKITTRIQGSAPSHKNGSFLLRTTPYFQGEDAEYLVRVDEQGNFEWQDTIREATFFQLTDLYGTTLWGYLQPGNDLDLHLLNKDQWQISGNTREECHYLTRFFETYPRYLDLMESNEPDSPYEADLEQFWQDRLAESKQAKAELTELADQLSPDFVALQQRQIDFLRTGTLNLNLSFHYIFQFRSEAPQPVPPHYQEYVDDQIMYDGYGRSLPGYRALQHLHLQRKMFDSMSNNMGNLIYRSSEPIYYFSLLTYSGGPLYQTAFDNLKSLMDQSSKPAQVEHLFQHFQTIFTEGKLTRRLQEHFQKMQDIQKPGTMFPDLSLYDEDGQPVSLYDLHGQPSVIVIVRGYNYWDKTLVMEKTPGLVPGVQFVFLHLGPPGNSPITRGENIRHWHARINSPAVATTFLQTNDYRHPRVYLMDRSGKISSTLSGAEHYSEEMLPRLQALEAGPPLIDKQQRKNILLLLLGLLGGGLVIGLLTLWWQRRLRLRELNRRQRVESQLQTIRSQLNPHFMFNSMNSIQHLIRSGQSDRAQSYLGKLASLLRASLRHTRENFISLQEELEVVGQYCELEALRFNFTYDLKIDHQLDTRAISVPPLLLQPYVENAVLHGIAPLRERGKLWVDIREQSRQLWICIRDNGQGMKASRNGNHRGNGIGLTLNAERLKLVYGDAAQVHIYSPSPTDEENLGLGTEVQIAMPIDV
ncbi:histidine kinase [Flavilitoribacter nigricans]|uniref:Histidine kinase/HSP90-like ATPase domain-containing protein n=1 Tax=Flavilitoribacter nigricans (strain ATCC 23147 / DSM 23189 / NBRC 102662 / NCIMB 1420 / SS-2) TaxID=1122177 RepID=A0A2D0NFD5_FLAN2|nr:histidine kinase [Flavilitoribacter nigricans]PHN07211.1 hypothetical protein CRP01_08295 [Flavilitoribacter nigricans DSM 23189 = NBRC 102662]